MGMGQCPFLTASTRCLTRKEKLPNTSRKGLATTSIRDGTTVGLTLFPFKHSLRIKLHADYSSYLYSLSTFTPFPLRLSPHRGRPIADGKTVGIFGTRGIIEAAVVIEEVVERGAAGRDGGGGGGILVGRGGGNPSTSLLQGRGGGGGGDEEDRCE